MPAKQFNVIFIRRRLPCNLSPLAVQLISTGKLNAKTGPALILYFSILLVSNRLLFFCVLRKLLEKSTSGYTFISQLFSDCWDWSVGPLQLSFPPWLKPRVTPLPTCSLSVIASRSCHQLSS